MTTLDFWGFVHERQAIWHRKTVLGLPAPWTSDPVLHRYFFTNVQRELDRGTIALRELVVEPGRNSTLPAVVYSTMLYRLFNREDMWRVVNPLMRNTSDFHVVAASVIKYEDQGGKTGTAAWQIQQATHLPGASRARRVLGAASLWPVHELTMRLAAAGSFMEAWESLEGVALLGDMLRTQVTLDMTYLFDGFTDDEPMPAYDRVRSALNRESGPGAALRAIGGAWDILSLRDAQSTEFAARDLDWAAVSWNQKPRLTMADIEHALCEYNKYLRLYSGVKTAHRVYHKGNA